MIAFGFLFREFDNSVVSVKIDLPAEVIYELGVGSDDQQCLRSMPGEFGQVCSYAINIKMVTPSGELWDLLRFNSNPLINKAAIVKISDDSQHLSFDPADFIDFPGGITKFTIRRDSATGLYLSLVNDHTEPKAPRQRNILALAASENLRDWRLVERLMEDDTGLSPEDSIRLTGFQYVDWQFDDHDIIYAVRTAYRGAIRYHDSNRIVYRVLKNYVSYLDEMRPE